MHPPYQHRIASTPPVARRFRHPTPVPSRRAHRRGLRARARARQSIALRPVPSAPSSTRRKPRPYRSFTFTPFLPSSLVARSAQINPP
ncbi:hypothetical protein K438DRAFT_1833375 [Mycena galopus ATCC 62051]|nr:hypothetical protein K438DRAFT_1833375 [Mycena galopus ATCC 62051]